MIHEIHVSVFSADQSHFLPVMMVEIAPKMQKMVIVEAPFIEELSGMAIVKILDIKEQTTNMIKFEVHQKQSSFEDYK